jgi:hypothetical protein
MEDQNYFIPIKELVFFCFFIQFPYLSDPVIFTKEHIAASQVTTIISITTR